MTKFDTVYVILLFLTIINAIFAIFTPDQLAEVLGIIAGIMYLLATAWGMTLYFTKAKNKIVRGVLIFFHIQQMVVLIAGFIIVQSCTGFNVH